MKKRKVVSFSVARNRHLQKYVDNICQDAASSFSAALAHKYATDFPDMLAKPQKYKAVEHYLMARAKIILGDQTAYQHLAFAVRMRGEDITYFVLAHDFLNNHKPEHTGAVEDIVKQMIYAIPQCPALNLDEMAADLSSKYLENPERIRTEITFQKQRARFQ
jgi:hypothetical protein